MHRLGRTSFGGGLAGCAFTAISYAQARWVDTATTLQILTQVGRALPGANGIKATVQIQGSTCAAGWAAAVEVLMGPLSSSSSSARLSRPRRASAVQAVLDGMAAAAIGLTFDTGLRSAWHGKPGIPALAVTAATVVCIGFLNWPMVPVVLVLAPLSVALASRRRDA